MKKLITVTGCFLMASIIITSGILPSLPGAEAVKSDAVADTEDVDQNTSNNKDSGSDDTESFIIKEYNGKIAVFKDGVSEPIYVSDSSVSNLPETDRELLKNGITVNSQKDLNRLIEDYCS